jgi:hypothetical protein
VYRFHPVAAEVQVVRVISLVVVAVVEVTDVEGGVGEDQVDPALGAVVERLDRIAVDDLVRVGHPARIVQLRADGANSAARPRQAAARPLDRF